MWVVTNGISAEVMGLNPKGVAGGEIVGRSEDWLRPSTPLVFARGRLGECTIRLGYAPFLQAIVFRRVGSA